MSGHSTHSSDTSAAFIGLIGGAALIGAILYGIVLLTNRQFAAEHGAEAAEHEAAVTAVAGPRLA